MNEVITKLYEIEETAGNILKNAQRYKKQLQEEIELEKVAMQKEMETELQKRLSKEQKRLEAEAEGEIQKLQERYQEQIQALDATYDNHLDELAEEIFCKMIEV